MLKVERDRVEVDFAGLNHMVYGLKAKLDGVDVTEEVVERLDRVFNDNAKHKRPSI